VLEHLFYDALAKDHSDEDHYHSNFNCKIPFLNGGLFEPLFGYNWQKIDIKLPNELFSNEDETKEGDKGTGILDVFDRYNFTVAEDEPLEKEVAIDPEMLGKVFENLLPENLRKGKGAFYTPREIVHYMCQESLISYLFGKFDGKIKREEFEKIIKHNDLIYEHDLEVAEKKRAGINSKEYEKFSANSFIVENAAKVDQLLEDIKVCDPAIGSGAFPVGMMIEIVKARKLMTVYTGKQPKIYDYKRHAIQESIYGVDIDAGAIEIAKLRLWLSLVVDEDDIKDIEPLPNLDYKIMQGNSLLEEYEGIKLFDDKFLKSSKTTSYKAEQLNLNIKESYTQPIQESLKLLSSESYNLTEQLHKLHNEFFNQTSRNKKADIKKQIDELQYKLIEQTLKEQNKLDKLEEIKKLKIDGNDKFFLWKLNFAEVFQENGGFDVVIGNPPYIKEYTDKRAFDGLRDSEYYKGKMDLWYFFACIGLDILVPNGVECFIAPNNWISNAGASKLRQKIISESEIMSFSDFGNFKVFATAGIQTMVFSLRKSSNAENYTVKYRKLLNDKIDNDFLSKFLYSSEKAEDYQFHNVSFSRKDFRNKFINFLPSLDSKFFTKLTTQNVVYLKQSEIAQGIVPPQDFVNKAHLKVIPKLKIGQGIFNLSDDEKRAVQWTDEELKLIKPFYTTQELGKYYANPLNKLWVLYTKSDINRVISKYPNIKTHLDRFASIITSDFKPYGLHRARKESFFTGQKIASLRKCHEPTFTYSDFDCYVSQTYFVIKTDRFDLLFLTGLLNSKLIKFWLKNKGKIQGNLYQIDKEPLTSIPIIKANSKSEDIVASFTSEIIKLKTNNLKADITSPQTQIDQLVYKLYNLTDDEIKLVESSTKK
jgi:adenine-specific DNA-methyltransferase